MKQMRTFLTAAAAVLLPCIIAGCVPPPATAPSGHPNPIVVRQFSVSPGLVTLDPSLGFSLDRGAPGVPARTRAASVARAVAFTHADAITTELDNLGYDAIRSDTAGAEPGGRALIIAGGFDQIYEGHRHQNASVAADVEVSYQASPGAPPQRLAAFHLDSRGIRYDPLISAAAQRAGGVNTAAAVVGHAIARYTSDLARLNNWPGISR
jgi:hypothetical protein